MKKSTIVQMVKFYVVGGSGTVVNLCTLYALTNFLGLWYLFSSVMGIIVSVTTNFFGNKLWTFKVKENKIKLYINFWIASITGIIIQLALTFALVQYLNVWYVLAAFIAILIASFSNFLLSKIWVFKHDKHSNSNL